MSRASGAANLGFELVVETAAILPGTAYPCLVNGREILICNYADRFFAIENRCSHAEEPLACGRIRNGWISCPAHGARFDLESGAALAGPAIGPVATFALRVVDGMIEVAA